MTRRAPRRAGAPTGARRDRVPFWLRPKWVVGHLLVVVLVVAFVSAGFWQLRRHDERQRRNQEITSRAERPVVAVDELVAPGSGLDDVAALEFRPAAATGAYDPSGEVLVRPRSLDGAPGWHVVTPLVLADGRAVLVTRGFVPYGREPADARAAAAPTAGEVTVTGLVFPTQERQGIGPTDPAEGVLVELARVDIGRIQDQYDRELLPVHLQLLRQDPPQAGALPQLVPLPETDDGPHLSYAVQWFLFASVGVVGWPVLLWRTAREDGRPRQEPPAGGPGPEPEPGDDDGGGGGGGSGRPAPDLPREPVGAGVG